MQSQIYQYWLTNLAFVISSIHLCVGGPDYYSSRSLKTLWDIGHIVYFVLFITLLMRSHFIVRMTLINKWLFFLSRLSSQVLQLKFYSMVTARTPDAGDNLRDFSGTFLALVFAPAETRLKSYQPRFLLESLAFLLFLFLIWPFFRSLIDEAISSYQFPVLADFETPFEIDRWSGAKRVSIESIPSIATNRLLKNSVNNW